MSPKTPTKRSATAAPKKVTKKSKKVELDFSSDVGETDEMPYHRILFSEAEKIKKQQTVISAQAPSAPSLVLYRRIALSFVGVVAIILGVVLYISTMKAEIIVHPLEDTIVTEFLLDVVKTPTSDKEVRGRVLTTTLGRTQTVAASGNQTEERVGRAGGVVTLRNISSQSQALVKTTRLLSESGVLFRLQKDANVPANGSIEVPVLADIEGREGDVSATRFTIPGLSVSRQKEVYAVSDQAMNGGLATISVISQDELDAAIKQLSEELTEEAKTALRGEVQGLFPGESFRTNILSQGASVEAGNEASSFDVVLSVQVVGVFFDDGAIKRLAEIELASSLGEGREFLSSSSEQVQFTVEKVNEVEGQANIRVYLDGKAIPSSTSRLLDAARFVGLSAEEVKELLVSDGIAKDVEVNFSPPWVSAVPRLKDHVKIIIE